MSFVECYPTLNSLEKALGPIENKENPFSLEKIVALDEIESFPQEACNILNQWGFNEYYIPYSCGGQLKYFDELMMLMRLVARRDLTVAIGHGKTFLGASPVWVAGNQEQKEYIAEVIKDCHPVSLGLTEKNHGSDLVANEVEAIYSDGYYNVNGKKWLINNASRSKLLSMLVKTNFTTNSSRAYALLLIDKEHIAQESYKTLDKLKTHGVRGTDISGIEFKNARVNSANLVGNDGQGIEITLKSLQISRAMCCSLSLGALDTALRTTTKFTLERVLYNEKIINIAHVRETLLEAYTDMIINEILSICIARCLHVFPEKMNLYSAIAKYFVPKRTDFQIQELSRILGARHYLREEHDFGIFQKIMRDNLLVGLFDGSTLVNAQHICMQLPTIAKKASNKKTFENELLHNLFTLDLDLPEFSAEKLKLSSHGDDVLLTSIDLLKEIINENDPLYSNIEEFVFIKHQLLAEINSCDSLDKKLSLASEKVVYKYCQLIALCCCINFHYYSGHLLSESDLQLLKACIDKLVCGLSDKNWISDCPVILTNLIEKYQNNKLFSLINLDVL